MRYTTKRNDKNVIPLLNAVCGIDIPYWRIDRADELHSYLSGDAADKLAAYEDAEERGLLVMYEEPVKWLKDRAERLDYDGWVDTAIILEQAADAIEATSKAYQMMAEEYEKAYQMMAEAYEAEVTKSRWLPVTEEPPLKVGDDGYNGYLVFANGYYEVADYTTDKVDNVPYFCVDGEYEPNVTHWMPLPEPPKEGE